MNRYLFRFQHNAYFSMFKDELLEWHPNIVHCNDWQTLSLGAFAKSEIGSKLVFDSHELETHRNPPLPKNRKRWMERYEQKYLRKCDLVTTVCEPISEYLEKQYNIERPLVVYNAPIHQHLYPAHEDWGRLVHRSDIRQEANLSSDDFLLVSVGNATVNRGIENVLEALVNLPQNIHLAIVGKVTQQFRELLGSLINQYHLQERVHFIPPVNPTCVINFIEKADAGIISIIPATLSYDYALPNKLFECAFARLPIIASDTQEIKRKVVEYSLGVVYQSGNIEELRQAVKKVYDNSKLKGFKQPTHQRFVEDHRFEKCAINLLKRFDV